MKACLFDRSTAVSALSKRAKSSLVGFFSAALFGMSCLSAQGSLIGHYQFNGNFGNSEGSLPSMTSVVAPEGTSGFLPEGGWYWENYSGSSSGLSLVTPELENYSFAITFQFSDTSNYKKVVDFSNLSADEGLYIHNKDFRFFAYSIYGEVSVEPNTSVTILTTRSSDGIVNLYFKGLSAPIITLDDSIYEYFKLGTSLHFFQDDRGNSEYSPAGSVSEIMIWDTALSAQEVGEVFEAIPEPMTLNLLGVTALTSFALRRFARRYSS